MIVKIKQSQLEYLTEAIQGKLFGPEDIKISNINKRCKETRRLKIANSSWCLLKEMRDSLSTQELKDRLDKAIDTILKYYGKVNTGVLPGLIELALADENKTISDLETLAEFFEDNDESHKRIKNILKKLNTTSGIPNKDELRQLFSQVKGISNKEYEESFVGNEFELKRTSLYINHRCSDNSTDDKLFNLIKKIQDNPINNDLEYSIDLLSQSLINCIEKSISTMESPIKADLELKKDLFILENGDKKLVLPRGYYEVKKLDPLVDSYLSEFFSIFKQSELSTQKLIYLDTYNKIIQKIYLWLDDKYKNFPDRVKTSTRGMIFHNNIIVPIKYIHFYWSNKSRGGCGEKRLCIRYRLVEDEIEAYRFTKGSDIVEKLEGIKPSQLGMSTQEEICKK